MSKKKSEQNPRIRYRVYSIELDKWIFTSTNYEEAEAYCDAFEGTMTLYIRKVWIP